MIGQALIPLINNAALLLALGLLYDLMARDARVHGSWWRQVLTGGAVGVLGIAVMLNPWTFTPGVIFDTRSVLLGLAGLFFGPVPAVIAGLMTALFRVYQGGGGALTGALVITCSVVIGLIWRHYRPGRLRDISGWELLVFGYTVHVVMLVCMLTLPAQVIFPALMEISAPVLTLYPVATLLLGKLMAGRLHRAEAELAIRESESRYRSLFENNYVVMLLVDPDDGAIIDANPAACQWYGWPSSTMRRMNVREISLLEETAIRERLNQAAQGERRHMQVRHRLADGSVRDVEVFSGPLLIGGRNLLHSIIFDVTDKIRLEEERHKTDVRFRTLVETAPDPIYIQIENRFAYLNPAALRAFGAKSLDQLRGNLVIDRIHPDHRVAVSSHAARHWEQPGDAPLLPAMFFTLDEKPIHVELSAVPFTYDNREGTLVFFRDTSERRRAEEQLQQSSKLEAIGQLAGGVAHDFNNILQAINGYAELTIPTLDSTHPARSMVEEIGRAGERAATLVGQLLAFSRRQTMQIKALDLNDVISDLLKMLRRIIGEHIQLQFQPGHDSTSVNADRGMMEQVLMNLCINARDAMPDGGELKIETSRCQYDEAFCTANPWAQQGDFIRISVSDTGTGMDEETLNHIFEPFFTTKKQGKGTGLGLATVYGIVKQHEGFLHVETSTGGGSRFDVYIPFTAKSVDSPSDSFRGSQTGGKETILLAEDDEMVRRLSKSILRRAGYTVITANNGAEAVQLFEQDPQRVDLLLFDVVMPQMNGRQAFEKIRAIRPGIPILFVSGYSEDALPSSLMLDEKLSLLKKPFTNESILRAVRKALERKKS